MFWFFMESICLSQSRTETSVTMPLALEPERLRTWRPSEP